MDSSQSVDINFEIKTTCLSTEKSTDPMRTMQRDRLPKIRYNMRGTSIAYRTANNMEGAKSSGKTVPPIGAGN